MTFNERVELKIISMESINGVNYFRFNTGQRMRIDETKSVWELNDRFDNLDQSELLVFDFSTPITEEYEYEVLYRPLPPTIGSIDPPFPSGQMSRKHRPLDIPLGSYSTIEFSYRFSPFFTERFTDTVGIYFVSGIGPVFTGIAGAKYELVSFTLQAGEDLDTSISSSTWGQIKELDKE